MIRFPSKRALEYAVDRLRMMYPGDRIQLRGRGLLLQAVDAARWSARFHRGPCYERKLAAAASLFYEVIMLHPLVDGNKRLGTLLLEAFLRANGLPRPRRIYHAALKVAGREWGVEEVYRWLLRVYRARRGGG